MVVTREQGVFFLLVCGVFFGFQGNKFFYLYRREIIIYSNRKISGKKKWAAKGNKFLFIFIVNYKYFFYFSLNLRNKTENFKYI